MLTIETVVHFHLNCRSLLNMARLRNYFVFISIACFIIFVVIIVNNIERLLRSSVQRYKIVDNFQKSEGKPSESKIVLFWTKFFGDPYWDMPAEAFRSDFLESVECPVTNCIFTANRNFLNHEHEYDAIVFHAAEWHFQHSDLPKTRSPHQVYIMGSKE